MGNYLSQNVDWSNRSFIITICFSLSYCGIIFLSIMFIVLILIEAFIRVLWKVKIYIAAPFMAAWNLHAICFLFKVIYLNISSYNLRVHLCCFLFKKLMRFLYNIHNVPIYKCVTLFNYLTRRFFDSDICKVLQINYGLRLHLTGAIDVSYSILS